VRRDDFTLLSGWICCALKLLILLTFSGIVDSAVVAFVVAFCFVIWKNFPNYNNVEEVHIKFLCIFNYT